MKTSTLLAAAVAFALAGCASVPPDSHALARRDVANAELSANIKLAHEGWPQAQWWTAYHDEQLNAIIKQALAEGPSLEVAAAHIGSARSSLSRSVADLGIAGTVNGNVNRQRYSGTGLFPAPIGGAYFTEETLRLDLRYNFDWWGKNRAQVAAAVGELNAGRAAYAEAEQALAAAIAQSYFRLQGAWARLANTDQLAATQNALVQDKAKRIARGLANADEQRAAEAELNLIRKQQAQLKADIEHEREALRALAGADNKALADLKPVAVSPAPHALPARLGMELLARRPDLQAARWKLEASLSKIDAAKAAYYPDVNLTGSIGLDSVKAEDLLQFASRTLYIGPSVSLPLFDSKRLDAQLDGARTNRNERIAEYNQTIVEAVREVAQGGAQLQGNSPAARCTSARAYRCRCSTASASMRSWTALAPTATNASPSTTRPSSKPCAKWRKAARSCKASNSRSCSKALPPQWRARSWRRRKRAWITGWPTTAAC